MKGILRAYAEVHRDYCARARDAWIEARDALGAIDASAWGGMPEAALPPRPNAGR